MSKYIGIRLSDEVEALLLDIVGVTKKTKSFHIKQAIQQYLEDISDYIEGVKVLNSNEKNYSLKEAKKILGIIDNEK